MLFIQIDHYRLPNSGAGPGDEANLVFEPRFLHTAIEKGVLMAGIDYYLNTPVLLPARRVIRAIRFGVGGNGPGLPVALYARRGVIHQMLPKQPRPHSVGTAL